MIDLISRKYSSLPNHYEYLIKHVELTFLLSYNYLGVFFFRVCEFNSIIHGR